LRFWPADQYEEGKNPPSYDKQYVRNNLGQSQPAPKLPGRLS